MGPTLNFCLCKTEPEFDAPTIDLFDTLQWVTGFLKDSDFALLPKWMFVTGCHFGMVTKMLSKGFQSRCESLPSEGMDELLPLPFACPLVLVDALASGSLGVNEPSSLSLS